LLRCRVVFHSVVIH